MGRNRQLVAAVPALVAALWMFAPVVRAADPPAGGETPKLPVGSSLGVQGGAAPPKPGVLMPEIDIKGDPVIGDPSAPVTVVEFIDYECPYCRAYAKDVFPDLKANYIDTGKVRYVVHDFPLDQHKLARPAAIAVACAREQGHFLEMHVALLTVGDAPTPELIASQANSLGLDVPKFTACRAEQGRREQLDDGVLAAGRVGVRATPSFLFGASAGTVARGRLEQGGGSYAAFEKILSGYLKPAS